MKKRKPSLAQFNCRRPLIETVPHLPTGDFVSPNARIKPTLGGVESENVFSANNISDPDSNIHYFSSSLWLWHIIEDRRFLRPFLINDKVTILIMRNRTEKL